MKRLGSSTNINHQFKIFLIFVGLTMTIGASLMITSFYYSSMSFRLNFQQVIPYTMLCVASSPYLTILMITYLRFKQLNICFMLVIICDNILGIKLVILSFRHYFIKANRRYLINTKGQMNRFELIQIFSKYHEKLNEVIDIINSIFGIIVSFNIKLNDLVFV